MSKGFTLLILTFYLLLYLFSSTLANLDFAEGRYLLFMDELISYDQTIRIISPRNFTDFFYQFFDGDEHRYGRIMYWILCLGSFLPYYLFGEAGLIIANRMMLEIVIVFTVLLTCKLFKNIFHSYRPVFYVALLLLVPCVPYYSSMPKPEPFYLFFIVLFLIFYWKNNFTLGKYFILLGLIFSLKISTLPFVLFTFFYSCFIQFSTFQKTFTQLIKSLAYFLVGFLFGTPYLVMLLRGEMSYLHKYLGWTFYATGHGSDNVLISYKDWILAIGREWSYLLPYSVFILPFLGICFWLYYLEFQNLLKKRKELFKI